MGEIFGSYGADALRIYLMNSALVKAEELNFSGDGVKEVLRAFHLPLWNSYSFFVTYANVDGWEAETGQVPLKDIKNPLDRWILSALERVVDEVNTQMERYAAAFHHPFLGSSTTHQLVRSAARGGGLEERAGFEKKGAYTPSIGCSAGCAGDRALHSLIAEAVYRGLRTDACRRVPPLPTIRNRKQPCATKRGSRDGSGHADGHMGRASATSTKSGSGSRTGVHLVTIDTAEREILARLGEIVREELNVKESLLRERGRVVELSVKAITRHSEKDTARR